MNKAVIAAIIIVIIIIIIVIAVAASSGTATVPAASAAAAPAAYTLPAGVTNGEVIRCATDGAIYIINNNTKRHYPNWATYVKYGTPAYTTLDCSIVNSIPTGPDMP